MTIRAQQQQVREIVDLFEQRCRREFRNWPPVTALDMLIVPAPVAGQSFSRATERIPGMICEGAPVVLPSRSRSAAQQGSQRRL
jgi:hypothetical protein